LLCAATGVAQAEAWPSKPVRVVVPYGPGGIADISARSIAQKMSEITGQSFIVENRPGADTRIGTEAVSREQGNDHVMLLAGGGFAVNNALFDDLRYNTATDFVPLGLVVSNPLLLVSGKSQPYNSVMELDTTDRKSTRLNSSHVKISYAVFCLKKKRRLQINHQH